MSVILQFTYLNLFVFVSQSLHIWHDWNKSVKASLPAQSSDLQKEMERSINASWGLGLLKIVILVDVSHVCILYQRRTEDRDSCVLSMRACHENTCIWSGVSGGAVRSLPPSEPVEKSFIKKTVRLWFCTPFIQLACIFCLLTSKCILQKTHFSRWLSECQKLEFKSCIFFLECKATKISNCNLLTSISLLFYSENNQSLIAYIMLATP